MCLDRNKNGLFGHSCPGVQVDAGVAPPPKRRFIGVGWCGWVMCSRTRVREIYMRCIRSVVVVITNVGGIDARAVDVALVPNELVAATAALIERCLTCRCVVVECLLSTQVD